MMTPGLSTDGDVCRGDAYKKAWNMYVLRQIIEKMSLSPIQRSKCAERDVRFSYLIIFGFFYTREDNCTKPKVQKMHITVASPLNFLNKKVVNKKAGLKK